MPGFTHLQVAQPVSFGHHLLAYVEMIGRDRGRLADCRRRLNESPLGAAALAGTSYPIDRAMTARLLGFDRPAANSIDAVSDRDFVVEALAAAALIAMHLSRLAEELVLWSSAQFGFIALSDRFTTGSSIMPQKRNPDAAELMRGKTGRIAGALIALLTVMKGLALTYSKDMQEDKEPLFDAFDSLALCLAAATGMVRDMRVHAHAMARAAGAGHATATDLADWLVQEAGLPFREAHAITGRIVKHAEESGRELKDLPLADLQAFEPRIAAQVPALLDPAEAIARRHQRGRHGTARGRPASRPRQAALSVGTRPVEGAGAERRAGSHDTQTQPPADDRGRARPDRGHVELRQEGAARAAARRGARRGPGPACAARGLTDACRGRLRLSGTRTAAASCTPRASRCPRSRRVSARPPTATRTGSWSPATGRSPPPHPTRSSATRSRATTLSP